jgi:hypothetical protein
MSIKNYKIKYHSDILGYEQNSALMNMKLMEKMFPIQRQNIIDIHCHTAGIGAGDSGCFISERLKKSWKFHIYMKAFGITGAEVAACGDALIIERLSARLADSRYVGSAVILAMDGVTGSNGELDLAKTEMYVPDDFISVEVCKYTNLHFGASINPYRRDAVERLDKAADNHAVLIKWLPNIQLIDPSDRKIIPFYRRLRDLGLPLLAHTGHEYSFTRTRNDFADPERLRLPLEFGVTVIAAHTATSGRNNGMSNFDRILPMFKQYPNLYADISSLTQINKIGHLKKVLGHANLHEKLLYGSDMPLPETGISSPFFFAHNIGLVEGYRIARIENPWDRDVSLKLALGVPLLVFEKAFELFHRKN